MQHLSRGSSQTNATNKQDNSTFEQGNAQTGHETNSIQATLLVLDSKQD